MVVVSTLIVLDKNYATLNNIVKQNSVKKIVKSTETSSVLHALYDCVCLKCLFLHDTMFVIHLLSVIVCSQISFSE